MARPYRMATAGIRIRLLKTGSDLLTDDLFGEKDAELEQQFDSYVTVQGQPRLMQQLRQRAQYTGDGHQTDGYITFARHTLRKAGITDPQSMKNARVVSMETPDGWETCNLLIVEVRNRGHLAGGSLLVKAFFQKYGDEEGSGA